MYYGELYYEELIRVIPPKIRRSLSEKLIDILLEAKEFKKVPSSVSKMILHYWHKDQLHYKRGLKNLLMAVEKAAPEKAAAVLAAYDLSEIKHLIARWKQNVTYRAGINFMPLNF